MTLLPNPRPTGGFQGRVFPASESLATASSDLHGLLAEFTRRWERGESPRAEDFLGLLAPSAPADVVELVYHEYCLAESSGLAPDPSSYLLRFPDHRDRLGRLFGLHEAWDASTLGGLAAPPELPVAGDQIGPYRLLRELGSGGFARVFLAEQEDLDDRLVVLKVSARASAEPLLLARVRHSHIVEVLRHHEAEGGALHLVCMPFLGGATLAAVLAGRRKRGGRPRSGRDLLKDLDEAGDPAFAAPTLSRPAREILSGLSYAKAVAWVVARLAEALDHAHRRGVAHGDLKPANILLTADGHPLLFDFNLAVDWGLCNPSGDLGGTLAYLAPERLRAVAEPGVAPNPRARDRHKADIFAMGLILRECLGGPPPAVPRGGDLTPRAQAAALYAVRRRERTDLARVPASLSPILARCLAADPADRYGCAGELAEDLDRWRADRPPAFAPSPAWRFTLGRLARRRHAVLAAGALALAVGVLTTVAAGRASDGPARARAFARRDEAWSRIEPMVFRFRDGWQVKSEGDPVDSAGRQLDRYAVLGAEDWRLRDDVRPLPVEEREELEAWLMEQAWRYASALQARNASDDDLRRALACLERASTLAPSAVFEAGCRALRSRLGRPEPDPAPRTTAPMPGWMEEYLLGIEAEPLHAAVALDHYQNVLLARPGSYWARYRAAGVACRLGDFEGGATHLERCVRRFPKNAALRTLLAGCLNASGKADAALEECGKALALDTNFREAIRTKALIHARLGLVADLKADISRYEALSRKRELGSTWPLRLEISGISGEVPTPSDRERALEKALAEDPEDSWARLELARGLADRGRLAESLAQCDLLLATDPDNLRAQFARCSLLRHLDRDEALRATKALVTHPRLGEFLLEFPGGIGAFHYLTRLHLERGEVAEGLAVAHRGLAEADRSATLRGESHYWLACSYALAGRSDPSLLHEASGHLKLAAGFHRDYQDKLFPLDPLFDPVRPALVRLLNAP